MLRTDRDRLGTVARAMRGDHHDGLAAGGRARRQRELDLSGRAAQHGLGDAADVDSGKGQVGALDALRGAGRDAAGSGADALDERQLGGQHIGRACGERAAGIRHAVHVAIRSFRHARKRRGAVRAGSAEAVEAVEDAAIGAELEGRAVAVGAAGVGGAVEHVIRAPQELADRAGAVRVVEGVQDVEDAAVPAHLVGRANAIRAAQVGTGVEHAVLAFDDAGVGIGPFRAAIQRMQRGDHALGRGLEDRAITVGAAAVAAGVEGLIRSQDQLTEGESAIGVVEGVEDRECRQRTQSHLEEGAIVVAAAVDRGPKQLGTADDHVAGQEEARRSTEVEEIGNGIGSGRILPDVAAAVDTAIAGGAVDVAALIEGDRVVGTGAIIEVEGHQNGHISARGHLEERSVATGAAGVGGAVVVAVLAEHQAAKGRIGAVVEAVGEVEDAVVVAGGIHGEENAGKGIVGVGVGAIVAGSMQQSIAAHQNGGERIGPIRVAGKAMQAIEDGPIRAELEDGAVADRASVEGRAVELAVATQVHVRVGVAAVAVAEIVNVGEDASVRADLVDVAVAVGAARIGGAVEVVVAAGALNDAAISLAAVTVAEVTNDVEDAAVRAGLVDHAPAVGTACDGGTVEHAVPALGDMAGQVAAIGVAEAVDDVEDGTVRAHLEEGAIAAGTVFVGGAVDIAVAADDDVSKGIGAVAIAEAMDVGETGAIRLHLEDVAGAGGSAAVGRAVKRTIAALRQLALRPGAIGIVECVNRGQRSRRRELEDGAVARSSTVLGGAVVVAITSLNEAGVGLIAIGNAEVVQDAGGQLCLCRTNRSQAQRQAEATQQEKRTPKACCLVSQWESTGAKHDIALLLKETTYRLNCGFTAKTETGHPERGRVGSIRRRWGWREWSVRGTGTALPEV